MLELQAMQIKRRRNYCFDSNFVNIERVRRGKIQVYYCYKFLDSGKFLEGVTF